MRRIAVCGDGDLGGAWNTFRQIWCREQRQALSMGTIRKRSQGESGKRNLTHQMLWLCEPLVLLVKVGSQGVNGNRAENFFSFVTVDFAVWFLDRLWIERKIARLRILT